MSPAEYRKALPNILLEVLPVLGCTRACGYGGARTVGQLGRGPNSVITGDMKLGGMKAAFWSGWISMALQRS